MSGSDGPNNEYRDQLMTQTAREINSHDKGWSDKTPRPENTHSSLVTDLQHRLCKTLLREKEGIAPYQGR